MIKLVAIAAGTAIALTAGFSIKSQSANISGAETLRTQTAVFHNPRIDGANLDVRFMEYMLPSARQVAERFCRDQGYSGVSNLLVRPSTVTRTITDGAWHVHYGQDGTRQTFSIIECASQNLTMASAH